MKSTRCLLAVISLGGIVVLAGFGCKLTTIEHIAADRNEALARINLSLITEDSNASEVATARLTGFAGSDAVLWQKHDGEFRLDGYLMQPKWGFLSETSLYAELPRSEHRGVRTLSYREPDGERHRVAVRKAPPLRIDWILRSLSPSAQRFDVGYSPSGSLAGRVDLLAHPVCIMEPQASRRMLRDTGQVHRVWTSPKASTDGGAVVELTRAVDYRVNAESLPFEDVQYTANRTVRLVIADKDLTETVNDLKVGGLDTDDTRPLRHPLLDLVSGTQRIFHTLNTDEDDVWLAVEGLWSDFYVPGLVPLSWHPEKPLLLALRQTLTCDPSTTYVFVGLPEFDRRDTNTRSVKSPLIYDTGISAAGYNRDHIQWNSIQGTVTVGKVVLSLPEAE